ncbi:hypothetical protein BOO91_20250 [Vibrio navarrensis]|uniref:Uncharacterized protein n=1 Tax=Vibrio navarrensis TaxID=29495 RepID=A0AAJ4I8L9_9VIBR|nr:MULTISPECIES: hypothetical protein [Vibrio]KJR38950.1 hypothetical protein UF06_03460 [Vibrio sp. S234-5]MBE3663256.1 hypothetical protein [Vibrio navarrensis]MBE4605811.1 hypothetical protein [Vibrio navarrensis]QPL52246.1 hypothetical protein I3X05_09045 [Vibrio navarrensis]
MDFVTRNLESLENAKSKFIFLISEIEKIDENDKDLPRYKSVLADLSEIIDNSESWDKTLSRLPEKAKNQVLNNLDTYNNDPQGYTGVLALSSFVFMLHTARDLQNPEKIKAILKEVGVL